MTDAATRGNANDVWSRENLVNLMTAVSKANPKLNEQGLFKEIADVMLKHLRAPAQASPSQREFALERAALDFIHKVDRGEARSKNSYAAFKAALALPAGERG